MHMICPSMPIPASTELTEFLYISCRKKILHPSFDTLSLLVPGGISPCLPPHRPPLHCGVYGVSSYATAQTVINLLPVLPKMAKI